MPTYTYEAKDGTGNAVSGLIEAGEERGAAASLREQGLWPTRLTPVGVGATGNGPVLRPGGMQSGNPYAATGAATEQTRIDAAPFLVSVPLPDLAMMYRQLSTLLNAGVPMSQALATLAQQTRNGRLQGILRQGATMASSGQPLSALMAQHQNVFNNFQIEMIRAGETSGLLETMCTRIAGYLERETEIRRKLKMETLYPKITLFVAGCVLVLLAFLRTGAQGALARVELGGGFLVGGFAIWWLARYLNQYPQVGAAWDEFKMLIPGAGSVARKYATARFCRALGALYAAGVLLPTAVGIAARACGNRAIATKLQNGVGALMSGHGLSGMLAQSGLLSPLAIQMAQTGEQTGSIDTMMDKVADYLESEADTQSQQLAKILGVAALILAAVVVASIVISFYAGMLAQTMREGEGG